MPSFRLCALALAAACAPRAQPTETLQFPLGESTAPGPSDVPPLSRDDPAPERVARAPLATGGVRTAALPGPVSAQAAAAECPTPQPTNPLDTGPHPITTIPHAAESTAGTTPPAASPPARSTVRANGTTTTPTPVTVATPAPAPAPVTTPARTLPTPAAPAQPAATPTTPTPTQTTIPSTPSGANPTPPQSTPSGVNTPPAGSGSGEAPTGVLTPPPPPEP